MRFALLLAGLCLIPSLGFATEPEESWPAFTGIVLVHERTWDGIHGGFTTQGSPQVLPLGTALHQTYESQVDTITQNVVSGLSSQGLYGIKLNLEQDIDSITVAPSSHGIRLAAFLRKNTLHFTASNNTILGSWADPTFDVTFDAMVVIDIGVGPSTSPMTVTEAGNKQVTVQPIQINSVTATPFNLVAKTDNVIVALVKAFNLVDLTKYFPQSINVGSGQFSQALNSALPFVQQAANAGYSAMEADLSTPKATSSNVDVFLTKTNVPTTGNGTISGKITWPASQGYPGMPDSSNFTWPVDPSLVAGFPLIQVQMPYTTYKPNGQPLSGIVDVGWVSATAVQLGANGTFEVDYTVSNLPYNAPLYVTIADSYNYPAWDHSNLGKTIIGMIHPKVFEAVGWQGFVTVEDPGRRIATAPGRFTTFGGNRQARPPAERPVINRVVTNPSGFGTVTGLDWTWVFKQVLPAGLTPIRLVSPGEAVERFGSNMGNTMKAGG